MWDFTPYETDDYVSAENDAVNLEHEREKKHARQVVQEEKDQAFIDDNDDGDERGYVQDGPEFSQEYESPEDVYLESDNNDD